MQKGIVLSIDDDENLQIVVTQYLESDGYRVISAADAATALSKLESQQTDIILLDLVLPDAEGLTLIPQLRAKASVPIIVVSGKSDTTEKIICLEMGADDYITKPFEMRELSARIKAVMRRTDSADNKVSEDKSKDEKIIFGNGWCLDRTQYQLLDEQNKSIDLTTGEFQLLEALMLSPNRALSRERLFELTRSGNYDVYDRAIDIQIARIRKKLNDEDGQVIKTIRGVGYMFSGNIKAA